MTNRSVKVSAKNQIIIPQNVRTKLKIKKGDRLLCDVQDRVIVLIPEPKRYTFYLKGLHSDIWKDVDSQNHVNGERGAWTKSGRK